MKKIISLLLVIAMMAMMCAPVVFADDIPVSTMFTPSTTKIEATSAKTTAAKILGVMQWAGIAIAVGMIIFAGIKYVMSGAGEKAKVKEQLVPILVGAILIGGATTVANIIFGLVTTTPTT